IADCGDKKYIRQVEAGTGTGNQNDLRLHFGLGKYQGPLNLKVIWPDGRVTEHRARTNTSIILEQEQFADL
ncbi:MAG: ASPIC/UnbV domain-containing protein, partial [Victivallales bacterium]|nr:ASPIC/UnbV domain-containing protein [Victivallales bacterium]